MAKKAALPSTARHLQIGKVSAGNQQDQCHGSETQP